MAHNAGSLEEKVQRGEGVRRLLADEHVQSAFADLRERTIKEWEQAKTVAAREESHAVLQALHKLQVSLRIIVDAGEHAKIELQRAEKAQQTV
ncbi:MAG TPA: hypothetical protein VFI41_12770 [Gemmatimonadales bacterium]|nr:hypothetical protein [Gemmatimonadales bacterium]